jgi:Fe-S oxidoreductase
MNPIAMSVALLGLLGAFAWSAKERWALLRAGQPEPRFSIRGDALAERIRETLIYGFGQRKMPYYPLAGAAHMAIFAGFVVLLLRSILLWGRGFDAHFDFWGLLGAGTLLGDSYSAIKDLFALLVLAGASVFVYLRLIKREKRMSLSTEGLVILGIIASMMLADFLYDGALIVEHQRAMGGGEPRWSPAEPVGSWVAQRLFAAQLPMGAVVLLKHLGFWWHSLFVLIFLNLLPYSKHFHILTAIPNVFARVNKPLGALPPIDDIERRLEHDEPIGIAKATDLSWKAILDAYTCTECGRCSDNCPATTTGKVLSPKHLIASVREHLYASSDRLTHPSASTDNARDDTGEQKPELGMGAPAGAYFRSSDDVPLVGGIMHPDVIWGCTTCRACEEQCPVMISFVDKIVGMRRHQVIAQNEFPPELQKFFSAMETNANPWNLPKSDRASWADGLDVPTLEDNPHAPVLFWVGCAASYDDRAKKVARSTTRLLAMAGVDFAILGTREQCTGDPARRAGNEYVFQLLASANIETLREVGAEKKTILTTCPHCFNTLLREYPQFGGHFNVIHHTEYLQQLIADKKLTPVRPVEQTIAYHDSCYLGRYNDVYDAPRAVLESIPGVELVEVPHFNRNKGLCCGAGGAQMWMEEQNEQRVNKKRTLQLVDTGATTVASACPFCMVMVTDGIGALANADNPGGPEPERQVRSLDIAEILEQSVGQPCPPVS